GSSGARRDPFASDTTKPRLTQRLFARIIRRIERTTLQDGIPMTKVLAVILAAAVLPVFAPAARAQNLDEIFRKVNPSVVVVRSKGRDVSAGGGTRFNETGAGGRLSTSAWRLQAV